jgi:prevent-host-death family protein
VRRFVGGDATDEFAGGLRGVTHPERPFDKNVALKYHYYMKTELVTNLKRQATRILSDMRDSGESVLITEHGKPSAYLIDVDSFEFMQNKLRVLEGIVRGERAVLEERTYSEEEAKEKMSKWLD